MQCFLGISSLIRKTIENESIKKDYKFSKKEKIYNIVIAHNYFDRFDDLIFRKEVGFRCV